MLNVGALDDLELVERLYRAALWNEETAAIKVELLRRLENRARAIANHVRMRPPERARSLAGWPLVGNAVVRPESHVHRCAIEGVHDGPCICACKVRTIPRPGGDRGSYWPEPVVEEPRSMVEGMTPSCGWDNAARCDSRDGRSACRCGPEAFVDPKA